MAGKLRKCNVSMSYLDGKTKIKIDCSHKEFFGLLTDIFGHLMWYLRGALSKSGIRLNPSLNLASERGSLIF